MLYEQAQRTLRGMDDKLKTKEVIIDTIMAKETKSSASPLQGSPSLIEQRLSSELSQTKQSLKRLDEQLARKIQDSPSDDTSPGSASIHSDQVLEADQSAGKQTN